MAYTKYSLTPANNNAAPPDGAPEGMLPSAVNDTMRDMMAQIRDVGDGIRGGTYTMTAPVITGGSITGVALSGNTLTNPVITGGSINNTTVGATTRSTGAFTTLASNGATTFTAGTASTSTTTGTAVITGGLGVSGRINAANFDGIVGANTAAAGNFTTLGATGVATFSAGTVSAPAITTTGDTNTGIFFPAADTIAFTEGGAESMRVDSSGNMGIGTVSPSLRLNVNSGAAGGVASFQSTATVADVYLVDSGTTSGQVRLRSTSNALAFLTNTTERMRITSAGDVGIGTASASWDLTVSDGTVFGGILPSSGVFVTGTYSNHPVTIRTNDAERMRISATGNVGIGVSDANVKLELGGATSGQALSFSNTGTNGTPRRIMAILYRTGSLGTNTNLITSDITGSFDDSSDLRFYTAGGSERMRIDASGNLGLGVTPSAWSGSKALQIGGGSLWNSGGVGNIFAGANYYFDGANRKYIANGFATEYLGNGSDGTHIWYTAVSGTAGNNITFSERMRITNAGNVGIGAATSTNRMTVQFSNTATTANSDSGITILNSARGDGYQATVKFGSYESNNTTRWTAAEIGGTFTAYLDGANSGAMVFSTSNAGTLAERMRIYNTGGVRHINTISVGNATPSTSGAGVTFPATQSASSDANTLDDYEEGTWTPVVAPVTGSLTAYTSSGFYTKIGRVVTLNFSFTITTAGTASGQAALTSIPFNGTGSSQQQNSAVRETVTTGNIYFAQVSAGSLYIQNATNGGIAWVNGYKYESILTYIV